MDIVVIGALMGAIGVLAFVGVRLFASKKRGNLRVLPSENGATTRDVSRPPESELESLLGIFLGLERIHDGRIVIEVDVNSHVGYFPCRDMRLDKWFPELGTVVTLTYKLGTPFSDAELWDVIENETEALEQSS